MPRFGFIMQHECVLLEWLIKKLTWLNVIRQYVFCVSREGLSIVVIYLGCFTLLTLILMKRVYFKRQEAIDSNEHSILYLLWPKVIRNN